MYGFFFLALALWSPADSASRVGPWPDLLGPIPRSAIPSLPEYAPSTAPCSNSRLIDGRQLPLRIDLYRRWHPDKAWGRPELIDAIMVASEAVRWAFPHADPVVIGSLSKPGGGALPGHRSHRSGLDADIGLFWGDARMHLQGFRDVSPGELNATANWVFIQALLGTGRVERILLDRGLIARVRAAAIAAGDLTVEQAEWLLPSRIPRDIWNRWGVVHHEPGHKHHMHLRVRCERATTPELPEEILSSRERYGNSG